MTRKTLILLFFYLLFFSWGINPVINGQENICKKKLNGVFTGTFPCLDCPGIKVTLVLKEDGTYELTKAYLEKNIAPIIEKGTVQCTNSKKTLLLNSTNHNKTIIRIRKNGLLLMDSSINEFNTGEENDYFLRIERTTSPSIEDSIQLSAHKWQLRELSKISLKWNHSSNQSPHIQFHTNNKKIYGFSGCNTFSGTYKLGLNNTIKISEIMATKKFCTSTMEVENAFLDMLRQSRYYSLENASLILMDQNQKALGTFKMQNL